MPLLSVQREGALRYASTPGRTYSRLSRLSWAKVPVIIGQLPVGSGLANCSELVIHRVIHISRKLEPHTPVFIASM